MLNVFDHYDHHQSVKLLYVISRGYFSIKWDN